MVTVNVRCLSGRVYHTLLPQDSRICHLKVWVGNMMGLSVEALRCLHEGVLTHSFDPISTFAYLPEWFILGDLAHEDYHYPLSVDIDLAVLRMTCARCDVQLPFAHTRCWACCTAKTGSTQTYYCGASCRQKHRRQHSSACAGNV